MTGGTGPARGMVVRVAVLAGAGGRRRGQGDRLDVTLDAPQRFVGGMPERHRPAACGAVPHGDVDGQWDARGLASGGVARGAVTGRGPLVVADLAAARGLERQLPMTGSGGVAG